MPVKAPQILGGEVGGVAALMRPIGFFDLLGHSHVQDIGATVDDFGMSHKIDSLLQPATMRTVALGGAIHSWHDQGNGAAGDGGWAHAAAEFGRDEDITGWAQTTMTGSTTAGANTALPVTDRTSFYAAEWVVVGRGATTEICQVASTYVGATGAGNVTVNSTANNHASGDAIYHAVRNTGDYLPKSQLIAIGTGCNDLPYLGPVAQGTFGTTAGASRGLRPLQNALRFTLAQLRCSQIYRDIHPSIVYTGTWTARTSLADFQGGVPWSYPPTLGFGPNGGSYHVCTAAAGTAVFSTDPDFPGGTVALFFATGNPPTAADGSGALWNVAVSGATTVSVTTGQGSVPGATNGDRQGLDTRNANAVQLNKANTTDKYTGCCYRITGLNAGVNTVTLTVATLSTAAVFLGWGVEAPQPPKIDTFLDPRPITFTAYGASPYYTRTTAGTATVSGSPATTVTASSAYTVGTTGTSQAAVFAGDTVTIGTGATRETRRIASVTSTTVFVVDSAFAFAHSGEAYTIGLQNADIVGGGYENLADTQGAVSVPGLQAQMIAVCNEFDRYVDTFNTDAILNPPGPGTTTLQVKNFFSDGLHYSNKGHALLAANYDQQITTFPWLIPQLGLATVPNKRSAFGVYGDTYPAGQPTPGGGPRATFVNSFTNEYPLNQAYAKTQFYKDMKTRMVYLWGVVTNTGFWREDQFPLPMFVLPVGYRPAGQKPINAYGPQGPGLVEVLASGSVYVSAGFTAPGQATSWISFGGSFLAEA